MDKFKIDSHKYSYHPSHASAVIDYYLNPDTESSTDFFRQLHPLYIEVSPVGACNHRCTFCAVDYIGYKPVFLDKNTLMNSLHSLKDKGVKSIMYAGEGEPLMHPDIASIVKYTKANCHIDVSFTTNAVHLTEQFVKSSLQYISWIKVSFNGGTPDNYAQIHRTNSKDFSKVSKNIEFAVNYRNSKNYSCNIGLQTLLLPDNKESIFLLCEHARNLGVDYLVIKPYSQHRFSNTTQYNDIDYSDYLDLQQQLESYSNESFEVIFRINTIKNWISQNTDRYCKCMATPSVWAYIMATGEVYSCSAYLLDKRFLLGNINELSFDQIWTSDSRMKNAHYVLNELDISECRVNCRMDQVNRYLDSIVNQKVPHINFI